MSMTLDEEIEHLKKRRSELRTIQHNLRDIFDWFESNDGDMASGVNFKDLEEAMEVIDITVDSLDFEICERVDERNEGSVDAE